MKMKTQKGKNESNTGIILFNRDFLEVVEIFLMLCPCGVAPRSSTALIAWGAQRWPHACLSSPCFSGRAPPEGPESVLAAQAPQGLRGRVWGSSSRKPLPAVPVSTAVSVSAPAGVAEPASLNDITSWHPSVKERPPVFLFLLL